MLAIDRDGVIVSIGGYTPLRECFPSQSADLLPSFDLRVVSF
jgi:hypothetical protein